MNYIIIKEDSLEKLENSVNAKIEQGYLPTGGILTESERVRKDASGYNPGGNWETVTWYVQAMLLKIKNKNTKRFMDDYYNFEDYLKNIDNQKDKIWEKVSSGCPYKYIKDCTDTSRFDITGDQSIPMPCSVDRCSYAKIKEDYENQIKKTTFEII